MIPFAVEKLEAMLCGCRPGRVPRSWKWYLKSWAIVHCLPDPNAPVPNQAAAMADFVWIGQAATMAIMANKGSPSPRSILVARSSAGSLEKARKIGLLERLMF